MKAIGPGDPEIVEIVIISLFLLLMDPQKREHSIGLRASRAL